MAKTKRVPPRSKVRREDTWDLSPLFTDDGAWERAYKHLQSQVDKFAEFKGKLGKSARALAQCCAFEVEFGRQAQRLGNYAYLKSFEDLANSHYQGMVARYKHLATGAQEAASFIAPEIRAIPAKKMKAFLRAPALREFRFSLEKLLRHKRHILSAAEERVLAMQGEVAGTAGEIFGQLNDADLKFGFVKDEKGEKVELTQSSLISLLESPKRSVRKKAFEKLYIGYEAHANTLAAALHASVLQDVYQARVRKYPSVLEAALFHDNVHLSVYDNLISTVQAHLDTLHRYLEVRRKALELKELHIYDCRVPLGRVGRARVPYDKAVTLICEGLRPLGGRYCRTLEKGLRGRWVDRYENQGKRSGAFSAGCYTGPPYISMNYKGDTLVSVFTLAHEAGHSMHTHYSVRHQPFQYHGYTIFVAEVASTFNEQLLTKHLLDRAKDKRTRIFLINREIDEIRGTLIRQTMFAEFEKTIHAIAENGEPLTLDRIRGEYRALLERYFGPGLALDEPLALEGLRIPHFYRAFYVYKYATGLSAAIALAERVLNGGKNELDTYLNFLKGGCSKYPLDLLRDAGVDMGKPEPVETAMARFKHLVDELERLI